MKFEKLFMKDILPALMLVAGLGIGALIVLILPGNLICLFLDFLLGYIALLASVEVYHKLYRSWLSTKQDELIEKLRQRAKAKGREAEENLDITLKYMEANRILADF